MVSGPTRASKTTPPSVPDVVAMAMIPMVSLTRDYLFFRPAEIPAGTYRGQDQAFSGLDVGSMQLITSADKGEDLVYELTKMIYEQREKVVEKHAAGRAINPENVVRDTGTPFHPGAERYYREIGIWPQ